MDKKKMLIGGIVVAAVVVAYVLHNKSKKAVTPTPQVNPLAKYEGKNIGQADESGNYDGGAIWLIKNGKKMPYGNNSFDTGNGLNWDTYAATNGWDVIVVSKSVVDSIPNA
jgi:hypothetical protein